MSSSRVSVARPDSLAYEIQDTKGSIKYDLTRINEPQYFSLDSEKTERGYKTLKGNVEHGDYIRFCATDELGISYADIMAIQAHDILTAIAYGHDIDIDIAYGHVDKVMAAMTKSAKEGR